jgi:hypothetical protein
VHESLLLRFEFAISYLASNLRLQFVWSMPASLFGTLLYCSLLSPNRMSQEFPLFFWSTPLWADLTSFLDQLSLHFYHRVILCISQLLNFSLWSLMFICPWIFRFLSWKISLSSKLFLRTSLVSYHTLLQYTPRSSQDQNIHETSSRFQEVSLWLRVNQYKGQIRLFFLHSCSSILRFSQAAQ